MLKKSKTKTDKSTDTGFASLKRWLSDKITPKEKRFEVVGAGHIVLSSLPAWRCGKARGFRTIATWYENPNCGGTMDWKQALKMATYIYWRVLIGIPSILKKDRW